MRILLPAALMAAASWASAQPRPASPPAPPSRPATIEVTGRARVSRAPDRVYIDVGVTTQAQKSARAAEQNGTRVSAVIAAVRRAAGPGAELTTTQYSIGPTYNYPRGGGTPTVTGYSVSNVVRVRLDDLRKVGAVIDAATQAGSNNVQDIRFALRDEELARAEALREAARNARQDAEALAGALDLRIVRVLAVGEESPETRPRPLYVQKMSVEAAQPVATPVEPGTMDVNATVTLTVEVAPAKR